MKRQITSWLSGFALLFVLVASASAQTASRIKVQIPFDFVAGKTDLHAGKYTVRRIRKDSELVLMFESEDGRDKAAVVTNSGEAAPSSAQVVFRQRGERYFLASVAMPGTASVRVVPVSKSEKRLAHELSERAKAGDAASKSVTVVGSVQ